MMRATELRRSWIVIATMLAVAAAGAAEDPQDFGPWFGSSPDAMSQIPAMTVPAVTLDFDLMPAGPTSVAAIQAQFPDSGVAGMVFATCTGSTPGSYNTNPSGRALGADPNGSLGLFLVDPPTGAFGCTDSLTITFTSLITQFGAQVADWNGPMDFLVYAGAANVGAITLDTTSAPLQFVESTVPFDRLVITAMPANPQANFVFPTLVFPEQAQQGDADLDIFKIGQTPGPSSGRYVITVRNLGPDDATGVVVNDLLPAGVSYVSDTCGGVNGTPWTWNIGGLVNGAMVSCTIDVDILDPANTVNVADVSGSQNDPNGSNNASTALLPPFGGPIPTLGTTGVMLLIGLIAGIGLLFARRLL
ncbi:MAG: hypothetical protein MUC56_14905 [Thermoanaerobaculales bacterium]|jgi:uncharacterized repeat protein (TIGR01451 family)|nr:hypothetical protein [Thermoanaerobaculales bacterium]